MLAGFVLGEGGFGVLEIDPRVEFVHDLAIVALIVILFRDGLEVEAEMLQTAWRLPLRKLVVAMPLTCVIVAVATHWLTDLGWTESFLLGALLSPTDPVLSSQRGHQPARAARRAPLAQPRVGAERRARAARRARVQRRRWRGDDGFVWWHFVLQDVTLGFAFGIAHGPARRVADARARRRSPRTSSRSTRSARRSPPTASPSLPPAGNGLIAVFVCAITLGIRRHDLRHTFEERADDIVEIVKLGVFVVFGSLLTLDGLFGDGWAAVAIVAITLLIARPAAIAVALLGHAAAVLPAGVHGLVRPQGRGHDDLLAARARRGLRGSERIFNLAALCVFASILAHGLTDTPGVELGR